MRFIVKRESPKESSREVYLTEEKDGEVTLHVSTGAKYGSSVCWSVARLRNDGTLKLIEGLPNDDGLCVDSTGYIKTVK